MTKLERVYEATAKALAAAKDGSYAAGEFADVIHELADSYETIDPSFDRLAFLEIADPD